MKISKNSIWVWLIKLNFQISNRQAFGGTSEYLDESERNKGKIKANLCGFFWQTIGAILLSIINIPGIIITLCQADERKDPGENSLGAPVLWGILQMLSIMIGSGIMFNGFGADKYIFWYWLLALVVGFIAIVITALLTVGTIELIEKIRDNRNDRKRRKRRKESENIELKEQPENTTPGFFKLTGQFFKAKKQKMCPRIEFIDDTKTENI